MGNQVIMRTPPAVRDDTMIIGELATFLHGLYVSAHSQFIQMEQFKKWMGTTLREHPAVVVAMAKSEKLQQFIKSIQPKECPKCHAKLE